MIDKDQIIAIQQTQIERLLDARHAETLRADKAMKLLGKIIDNCSASEAHIREYQKLVEGK